MSQSKFVMAKKLCHVQQSLMGMEFEDTNLQSILPIIFRECIKEKLTFWFSFIEQTAVLNLRDVEHENYELNIRQYYEGGAKLETLKRDLLINTFLIVEKGVDAFNDKPVPDTDSKPIISNDDKVMPKHIRKAIETIEAKGIPVTREAIQHHLPLGEMSTSARMECNKYLKEMEA